MIVNVMYVPKHLRRFTVIAILSTPLILGTATPGTAAPEHTTSSSAGATGPVGAFGRFGPLTDLVIQRLLVSDQVAAAKFGTDLPIDDPTREKQELDQVRQDATTMGIDADTAVRFFQQQIEASKIVQKGLFRLWTAHPELAPTSRPDLTVLRGQLDRLTTQLLGQLRVAQDLMGATPACRAQLAEARLTGEVINRLDHLHRHALSVALASVCAPTTG